MAATLKHGSLPRRPVYLLYGDQVQAILRERDLLLKDLLDPETRNENLTEYTPVANRWSTELTAIVGEIAGDLATLSLIADSPKVAVVTCPAELYGRSVRRAKKAKKKKAARRKKGAAASGEPEQTDREAAMIRWITDSLPQTSNHLVLVAYEEEAEGREVNERSALFQAVAAIGYTRAFRDRKAFFEIERALIERDPGRCLRAIGALWKPGKGDQAVYGSVVRCMRFLLQAQIERDPRMGEDPIKAELLRPARVQFSLHRASDWVQRKYLGSAAPYRVADLLKAYERLIGVYRALRPTAEDLVAPDARALLEGILLELFASPRPARR